MRPRPEKIVYRIPWQTVRSAAVEVFGETWDERRCRDWLKSFNKFAVAFHERAAADFVKVGMKKLAEANRRPEWEVTRPRLWTPEQENQSRDSNQEG